MIRSMFLFCFIIFCYTAVANAEEIEILVPEFEGTYTEGSYSRAYQLDLGMPIAAVYGMEMELTATITYGTGHGDGFEIPWDEWFVWPGNFNGAIYESAPGFWLAAFDGVEGQSTQLKQFNGYFDPTWDFLLDGTMEIHLQLCPSMLPGAIMVVPPFAIVENAKLIIYIDEPIATKSSTWGSIKVLVK